MYDVTAQHMLKSSVNLISQGVEACPLSNADCYFSLALLCRDVKQREALASDTVHRALSLSESLIVLTVTPEE